MLTADPQAPGGPRWPWRAANSGDAGQVPARAPRGCQARCSRTHMPCGEASARAVVLPKALPPARMLCRGCAALEAGVTRPSALPTQPDGVCASGTPPPPRMEEEAAPSARLVESLFGVVSEHQSSIPQAIRNGRLSATKHLGAPAQSSGLPCSVPSQAHLRGPGAHPRGSELGGPLGQRGLLGAGSSTCFPRPAPPSASLGLIPDGARPAMSPRPTAECQPGLGFALCPGRVAGSELRREAGERRVRGPGDVRTQWSVDGQRGTGWPGGQEVGEMLPRATERAETLPAKAGTEQ